MQKIIPFVVFSMICLITTGLSAQVYLEKQTRHRFAQLNIGLDFQGSIGGQTQFLNTEGQINTLDFSSRVRPRILIGGTHFWGHADFYIAIPVGFPRTATNNQDIFFSSGVETVFKYYPWQIQHHKIRPFIGTSLAPFYFTHNNRFLQFPSGPDRTHTRLPLVTGLTFNHKNHLLELSLTYNYDNELDYYLSRTVQGEVQTPPFYASLSYRFMLETTLSAEKSWEDGSTAKVTSILANEGSLNSFFFGAGMSSAWWLGQSSYNEAQHPFIENYGISLMPDFTLGYHFHNPDINIAVNYRGYRGTANAYGIIQKAVRQSIGLEVTKCLWDYHGFVPFIGPVISYERLSFEEDIDGNPNIDKTENQLGYGVTFGWDIRPNRLQGFVLRTNLRYFPRLSLDLGDDQAIRFDNIEFNFIQLIIYPWRMF